MKPCEIAVLTGSGGPQTRTILDVILSRNDTILVAGGSLGCLRSLYLQIWGLGKLSQFLPCLITPAEYAQGLNWKKMRDCIQRAVYGEGVRAVILYASCIDYLTGCDYDTMLDGIDNPGRVKIEVYFRGPLVKRTVSLKQRAMEIMASLPEEAGEAVFRPPFPVPAPDFDGLNGILEDWGCDRFLLTTGGCIRCLTRSGETDSGRGRLRYSRLDDVLVNLGCESAVAEAFRRESGRERNGPLYLLKSTVPSFISADIRFLRDALGRDRSPAVPLEATGWDPAPVAVERAYRQLGEEFFSAGKKCRGERSVSILGYSFLSNGKKVHLQPGIEVLRREGFQVSFWNPGEERTASIHWVVSAEAIPLARWAEKHCGIPFFAEIPVGSLQEARWRKNMAGAEPVTEPARSVQADAAGLSVFITGEPLLTEAAAAFFRDELGAASVRKGIYVPYPSWERLYRTAVADSDWEYFRSEEELWNMAKAADIFVGDPVFRTWVEKWNSRTLVIPVPYPVLSGNFYDGMDYEYFGGRGEDYLRKCLHR